MKIQTVLLCVICIALGICFDHFLLSPSPAPKEMSTASHSLSTEDPSNTLLEENKFGQTNTPNTQQNLLDQLHAELALPYHMRDQQNIVGWYRQWGAKDPIAALADITSRKEMEDQWFEIRGTILADWALRDQAAALSYLETIQDHFESKLLWQSMIHRSFTLNLQGVMDFYQQIPIKGLQEEATYGIAEGLAATDPSVALSWLNENVDDPNLGMYLAHVLLTTAENDPALAAQYLDQQPAGYFRTAALEVIASSWADQDIRGAFEWLDTLENEPDLDAAYKTIMGSYFASEPENAASLLSSMPESSLKEDLMQANLRNMVHNDIQFALDWLQALPSEAASTTIAMREIYSGWAEADPKAALASAFENDSTSDRSGFLNLVNEVSGYNPKAVQTYLDQIPAGENRKNIIERMANGFAQTDLAYVQPWVDSLTSPAERAAAISAAAIPMAQSVPTQAVDLAMNMPDSRSRSTLMVSVMEIWANSDRTAALDFLETAGFPNDVYHAVNGRINQEKAYVVPDYSQQ